MPLRRFALTTVAALTTATGLSACGGGEVRSAASEGTYVTTGNVQYQVQISRQLNPWSYEDQAYLVGVPRAERQLKKGQEWFAVFLRAFNRSKEPQQASSAFYITDTTGRRYNPTPIDQKLNWTVFRSWVIKPGDQIPVPGTPARELNTQGGVVLFKVPISAYATRPLELHIEPPAGGQEATVDLDV